MRPLITAFATLLLVMASPVFWAAAEPAAGKVTLRIVAQDPADGSVLGAGDRLYLHIGYESSVPVRFQAEALRQGILQEEAFINSAPPYDAGNGEALAWLGFAIPVRIDAIRVTAYDLEWKPLAVLNVPAVLTWDSETADPPREPAAWVVPLQKHHRHVFDTALDPLPRKPDPFFDIFLIVSIISIPFYVLVQIRMLVHCRDGWRKYAAVPLLAILPLCLYSLIGLGMETSYWIIFLTRFFPVALVYLGIVWLIKRIRDKSAIADSTS
jgi:hypothetical protein